MQADLVCAKCIHFEHPQFTCIAFPKGIPDIIISGESDHSKPLQEQDNDIVFEPIPK